MSGVDQTKVNAEFFPDGKWEADAGVWGNQ
jgi:hypothetical protein